MCFKEVVKKVDLLRPHFGLILVTHLPTNLFNVVSPLATTSLKVSVRSLSFKNAIYVLMTVSSVTRLGEFLHFGQPFKAVATIIFPKLHTLLGNFCKEVKIIRFSSEIIFGRLL